MINRTYKDTNAINGQELESIDDNVTSINKQVSDIAHTSEVEAKGMAFLQDCFIDFSSNIAQFDNEVVSMNGCVPRIYRRSTFLLLKNSIQEQGVGFFKVKLLQHGDLCQRRECGCMVPVSDLGRR
jgi:hypothetical protein